MGLRAAALASMACGSENCAYVEGSSGSNWMICLARSRDVVRGDPGPRDWDSSAIPRASNGIEGHLQASSNFDVATCHNAAGRAVAQIWQLWGNAPVIPLTHRKK